jgi:NifU-like protein involved in Fe-S cluster formation
VLNDLYSDRILAAAGDIPPARRLARADASARRASRVCGSEIVVDISIVDGRVADFAMEAKACALGQASASMLASAVIGASPAELVSLRKAMRAMLREKGPPPAGERWRALESLSAIRDYPQRHASTLLVFEAVADALIDAGYAAAD